MNKLHNYLNEYDYSTIEIIKQLEQANYWTFEGGLVFTCNGHSVNIYKIDPDQSGFNETGFYSIGDFAKDQATKQEFYDSVDNYNNQLLE